MMDRDRRVIWHFLLSILDLNFFYFCRVCSRDIVEDASFGYLSLFLPSSLRPCALKIPEVVFGGCGRELLKQSGKLFPSSELAQ